MVRSGNDGGTWLRAIPAPGGPAGRGESFERGGCRVRPEVKLGEIVQRRPPGVSGHQWSTATRAGFAFLVCAAGTGVPLFVVDFVDPDRLSAQTQRSRRMTDAVCEAVGLELLRVESSTLSAGRQGRRVVEYVIDARAFTDATADPMETADQPLGYRDIIGRLPDGRSGFVNDLGAVARVAAVEAYAERQVSDPIIRGLHVSWKNGPAEGWAWLEVRDGLCIFERTRVWQHRFSCGVAPDRLAEDLAVVAVGERLRMLDQGEPELYDKQRLGREFEQLRAGRDEMDGEFAFDHISFD